MKKIITIIITIITIFSYSNAKKIEKDRFVSIFVNHTLFINIRKIERRDETLIVNFGNSNREWIISYSDFTDAEDSDKLLFFSLSPMEIYKILNKLKEHKNIVIDFDALTKTYY